MRAPEISEGLTFDDVLLLPAHSRVLPREVDLTTRLTSRIQLKLFPAYLLCFVILLSKPAAAIRPRDIRMRQRQWRSFSPLQASSG